MTWPVPEPGLVIRYSYLWLSEAERGREEGVKDRPCAIVLAVREEGGASRVLVLPITHGPPTDPRLAIELPAPTKLRLNLDGERSWIVLSEANEFIWPGPDLRPLPGAGVASVVLGRLPPRFFSEIATRFVDLSRSRRLSRVIRSE